MVLRSPRFVDNAQLNMASENSPPLKSGSHGSGVRLVQQGLIDLGFNMPISVRKFGSPDGIYGNETVSSIKKFQQVHGLPSDGVAGRNTLAKLDQLLPTAGKPLPDLPTDVITHRVRLHFKSIAMPIVSEYSALANANWVYRQYGIEFVMVSGQSLLISPEEEVLLDSVDTGSCVANEQTDTQGRLFGLGSTQGIAADDIAVFYVNKAFKSKPSRTELAGCAASTGSQAAVLVSSFGSPWTLGHEVGHVLLGNFSPSHSTDSINLMFAPTSSISARPPRLTEAQVLKIKSSRHCKAVS